tara:strand:- start:25506 stop:25661 length:156 start_codon:yes stop_codon:yes gene_type:complete
MLWKSGLLIAPAAALGCTTVAVAAVGVSVVTVGVKNDSTAAFTGVADKSPS